MDRVASSREGSRPLSPRQTLVSKATLFDLHNYTICNSARLDVEDSLVLVTPVLQWYYALLFPVSESQRALVQPGCIVVVRLEGTVEVGQVGIGALASDMITYLVPEVVHSFLGREAVFELELSDLPKGCNLVVRNVAANNVESRIRIRTLVTSIATQHTSNSRHTVLLPVESAKVAAIWAKPPDDETDWADIPYVANRLTNQLSFIGRFCDIKSNFESVLSLCCGHGALERELARHLRIVQVEGLDISEGALEHARDLASSAGYTNIHYSLHDINRLQLSKRYDLVVAGGIHHLTNLDHVFGEVGRCLKPGAPLVMWEYVGPNRCQATARQIEAINACIRLLPERYRLNLAAQRELGVTDMDEGYVAINDRRAKMAQSLNQRTEGLISRDSMFANFFRNTYVQMTPEEWEAKDPSESVRSEDIIPLLRRYFADVVVEDYGGSILQFTLYDIARNFWAQTEETAELMDMLFNIERVLRKYDDIPLNYAMIGARCPIAIMNR